MSDKMKEVGQELVDQMMDCNLIKAEPTTNEQEKQSLGQKPARTHTYGAGQLFAIGRYVTNKMRDPYAQLEMMPTRLMLIERLRNAGIYRNHLAGLYVNPSSDNSGLGGQSHGRAQGMGPSYGGYRQGGHNRERYQVQQQHCRQQQQRQHYHQQHHRQQQQQQQLQQLQQLQQQLHQLQLLQHQQLQQIQKQHQQQQHQQQQQQQLQQQLNEAQDTGNGDANKFY